MINPDDVADSSSRKHENGDKTDVERPLKKARFAWQIKGKYHLKDQEPSASEDTASKQESSLLKPSDLSSDDSDASEKTFENGSDETAYSEKTVDSEAEMNAAKAEQNLENLGDYLMKQKFKELSAQPLAPINPLEVVTTVTHPYENSGYPHIIASILPNRHEDSIFTAPSQGNKAAWSEDQLLARWQTRQLARSFVDNTINRVLDSWLVSPLPRTMELQLHMALDMAEFLDDLPGNNRVENEGILMAISAHGLQANSDILRRLMHLGSDQTSTEVSSSTPRSADSSDAERVETSRDKIRPERDDEGNGGWSEESNYPLSSSDSAEASDDDERKINPWLAKKKTAKTKASNLSAATDVKDAKQTDSPVVDKETSESPASNVETPPNETSENSASDMLYGEHMDFMDAAVSFAIQNKGLTSFGADYG